MSMDVVGRQEELRLIGGFLDSISIAPGALILHGEAGIGKTTLWEAGLREARGRGWRVLACQAAQSEARLSYSSIGDLLGGVDDQLLRDLPDPQREAVEVVLLRARAPHLAVDHRSVGMALLTVLRRLSEQTPAVLAVDDFQWLDRASAQAVDFVTRRLTGRIGVLASIRAGQQPNERAIRLGHPGAIRNLEVGPLSLGAIHHVVRERNGRTYPRPTLVRIHTVSGGNPFFALELVQMLGDGTTFGPKTRFPATLAELTRTRLKGLDGSVRHMLLVAAALASPTLDVLDQVVGRNSYKLLEQAEELGIVELTGNRVRFTHPIHASGTYAMASPTQRRATHRRLAAVVGDIEERARHIALAATTADLDTIAALDQAAAHAAGRGASASAEDLLELALDLGAADPRRAIAAAKYHLDAGDALRATRLLEGVCESASPGLIRAQARALLAAVHHYSDSYQEARTLFEQALGEANGDQALRVRIQVELAFVLFNLGRLDDALALSQIAVKEAEQLGAAGTIARALGLLTILRFMSGQGLDDLSLEKALASEDAEYPPIMAIRPSLMASLMWLWSGRLDEAQIRLDLLRRESLERGAENDLIFLGFHAETLACWRGDVSSARSIASDAYERALQCGTDLPRGLALSSLAHAAAYAGDAEEARRAAEDSYAILERGTLATVKMVPLATLGFVELSLDNYAAAALRLAPMAAGALALGLGEPSILPFAPDAVEALVAVGRLEEARAIVDWLEEHGRRLDRAWALAAAGRCRSLILAAEGQLQTAIRCCEQALTEHDRIAMPFERARTQLVLGRLQRRSGQRRAANTSLDAALEGFIRTGTALWAEKARRELRALGIRPGRANQLTPSELRVAELAAAGRTNRQVAAALLISPKTVEANLVRIYQKLGIRSRAELGGRMADRQRREATPST